MQERPSCHRDRLRLLHDVQAQFQTALIEGVYQAGAVQALISRLILGLVKALVRPLLILLTLPFTILTLGLFLFVVNAPANVTFLDGTAVFLDVNGDALPDILQTKDGIHSWYRNLGGGQFQHVSRRTGITSLEGAYVGFGTGCVDVDSDGDLDAVAASGGATPAETVWVNDGAGKEHEARARGCDLRFERPVVRATHDGDVGVRREREDGPGVDADERIERRDRHAQRLAERSGQRVVPGAGALLESLVQDLARAEHLRGTDCQAGAERGQAAPPRRLPGVLLLVAGHDAEERRLPRAVATDDADAILAHLSVAIRVEGAAEGGTTAAEPRIRGGTVPLEAEESGSPLRSARDDGEAVPQERGLC